jgi:hypothetical protein
MPVEVLPVPALPCAWAPLVESSVATTITALMMLLSHICQFLGVTRLPPPRNDQAKQESDCEGLDRRLARQARQLVKQTTGSSTRLDCPGDALRCRLNGFCRVVNSFRGCAAVVCSETLKLDKKNPVRAGSSGRGRSNTRSDDDYPPSKRCLSTRTF